VRPTVSLRSLGSATGRLHPGLKFQLYRSSDSLKDYVLLNQEQVRVEQFTRQPDGTWTFRDYQGLDEELSIESIGVAIPPRRIYDRVDIPAQPVI
jgi:Uma2 family endonuclease